MSFAQHLRRVDDHNGWLFPIRSSYLSLASSVHHADRLFLLSRRQLKASAPDSPLSLAARQPHIGSLFEHSTARIQQRSPASASTFARVAGSVDRFGQALKASAHLVQLGQDIQEVAQTSAQLDQ
jgi:hypothetical protein